jgi:hypothetical protein
MTAILRKCQTSIQAYIISIYSPPISYMTSILNLGGQLYLPDIITPGKMACAAHSIRICVNPKAITNVVELLYLSEKKVCNSLCSSK